MRERCTVQRAAVARAGASRACATATPRAPSTRSPHSSSSAPTGGARRSRRSWAHGGPTASRATAAGSCSATWTTRAPDSVEARDLPAVARGRLVRVRLPDDARRAAARPDDGPPRRGERGAARPRGLLAAQAARAPGAARAHATAPSGRRSCARRARRPRSSAPPRAPAGRSRATRGTSRTRSPARACATRCSRGARSPSGCCRRSTIPLAVDRATRLWEAERDRECLPAYHFANADTRVERQPARSARARARRGPQRRAPTSATCSGERARLSEIAPAAAPRAGARAGSLARRAPALGDARERRCATRASRCGSSASVAPTASARGARSRAPSTPGARWPRRRPAPAVREERRGRSR